MSGIQDGQTFCAEGTRTFRGVVKHCFTTRDESPLLVVKTEV